MKGFKAVIYISFPFPKLLGAPDASFEIFFLLTVTSPAAGKAEPNLTEVIFTSASKPRTVQRTGCPLPSGENSLSATRLDGRHPRAEAIL